MILEAGAQIGVDKTVNKCLALGCAACCVNVVLFEVSQDEFDVAFKKGNNVKAVNSEEEVMDAAYTDEYVSGVYYKTNPNGGMTVGISDRCPNLNDDNRCKVYDKRPQACRNFDVDGASCIVARAKSKR